MLEAPGDGHLLESGEVLVAAMTSPDWVPTMRRVGRIDHRRRRQHVPCGDREPRAGYPGHRRHSNGDDHAARRRYRHRRRVVGPGVSWRPSADPRCQRGQRPAGTAVAVDETIGTKLYVNLAIADRADEVAAAPVDGVGLLRGEFMVTEALDGQHPRRLIAEGRGAEFVDKMSNQLARIARSIRHTSSGVPHDGLQVERIPRPDRWRTVRAGRAEPDDRFPRVLPVHQRPRDVRTRTPDAGSRARRASRTCTS